MKMPSVEVLMKHLHEVTGWGDSSCRVSIGYMAARNRIAQDETEVDPSDWGWVVSTTICGPREDNKVTAQGKSLEEALLKLSEACYDKVSKSAEWYEKMSLAMHDEIERFNMDVLRKYE